MKGKSTIVTVLVLGLALALIASMSLAQGSAPEAIVSTAFTYQGKLNDGGTPANGSYDFEFGLYDVASGGTALVTVLKDDVTIAEGLFTVQLDFGDDAFSGDARWLEISLRSGDAGPYTTLAPRQSLTPAPYALSLRPGATIHNTTSGSVSSALVLESDNWYGLYVPSAGWSGVYVNHAGNDGVSVNLADYNGVSVDRADNDGMYVFQAGNPSSTNGSPAHNGFEVAGAEGYGLYVGQADLDGVYVNSAAYNGVRVASADWDGVVVDSAVASGMYVAATGGDGVNVNTAGDDGVYVFEAGNPSAANTDAGKNGFEVAGAEGCGLYVGHSNNHGVYVNSSGADGVNVNSAVNDGLRVTSAGTYGVYANTLQADNNYGLYTPDNLYSLNYHLSGAVMLVAQSGDSGSLELGDVVSVSGAGAAFAGGETPAPLVQRAGLGSSVLGVVYSRYVVEEEVEEIERDGQVEQQTSFHARSAKGPAAPGDYLLVVVMGAAQVKAEAVSGDILPGDLLAASATGLATNAAPAEINGLAYYPPGSILGTAMGPLDVSRGGDLVWVLVNPR